MSGFVLVCGKAVTIADFHYMVIVAERIYNDFARAITLKKNAINKIDQ